ncbi:MobH family relaxase [Comamonas terrigena]|jgi:integrating conjugative element relaxase (TIGR03760 family)|uniref:MobH family relaxase n=1 Tax=Comamonas terrigena TaxID=32013 RepID=UPI0024497450|nr:MobH family relaxase [Comamonas terrigena]MDH0051472.1 TraI domain-containing protein [Comamonas terrigena]MDH0513846.1 TraI domain-containing protein [Comamonas terrigena]MDH1093413.1 TraI domain-containing protein [Comamonas terrigena]
MSIASKILGMIPWGRARPQEPAPIAVPAEPAAKFPIVAGSENEWLRVLSAEDLLTLVQASKALKEIYRQSRQSQILWERDLLPALHRYAEFVQLMPASESHHHAHAGGLLSHTIEMVLAAMTFRNAHLLPEGSAIEVIDHQRDHWTYVVFFAALLHDIAKPMTDLRIQWRCDGMADSIRWAAGSGSLAQITSGRQLPEYLVGFAPKGQRDYSAHAKLAQLLLPSIAPQSALSFLASQPEALDVLQKYLSGQDKDSLVAKIVKRADQLSTKRALQSGNRARFASARAVPLIDLLMQAISSMLRSGTSLPLNRTGAVGWVFDGAVWFVAKRLADLVRDWIKTHEPDEAIPGEAKNDRLFDTWQEYGVVELNPVTGQAIWHVQIQGNEQGEQGAYVHELSMLKFPLAKVFESEGQYPAPMRGQLVMLEKRKADAAGDKPEAAPILSIPQSATEGGATSSETAAGAGTEVKDAAPGARNNRDETAPVAPKKPAIDPVMAAVLRPPTFNKPPPVKTVATAAKPAPGTAPKKQRDQDKPAADSRTKQETAPANAPQTRPGTGHTRQQHKPAPVQAPAIDQHDAGEDAYLLDDTPFLSEIDSAAALGRGRNARKPPQQAAGATALAAQSQETGAGARPAQGEARESEQRHPLLQESGAAAPGPAAPRAETLQEHTVPEAKPAQHSHAPMRVSRELRDLVDVLEELPQVMPRSALGGTPGTGEPKPVLLVQELPAIPGTEGKPPAEPSQLALEFMQWVQQGLVQRTIKFNEAGAAVHFVPQGMALVSPRIFRDFAAATEGEDKAHELGARVQRDVIKSGWHLPAANRTNIIKYEIHSNKGLVGNLACVVLVNAGQWVQPVPPSNPALRMM